ncbi:MAG: TRAP transporter small permease [Anaerovoracaceae bacterium]
MKDKASKKWAVCLHSFDTKLATVTEYVCAIMLAVIMAVMFVAVLCRFIFEYSTPWSEELTRFTFIAMAFLGLGACLTKNEHIEIDVFAALANKIKNINMKYIVYKIDDLFKFVFIGGLGAYLLYMYFDYTVKQKMMNQISAGLHLPMWILYAVLTFAFVLLLVHCLINLVLIIADYSVVRTKESLEGGDI